MAPKDKKHTSFRVSISIYYYIVIPFNLKNDVATYQRATMLIFDELIHQKVECHVNTLIFKSMEREGHLNDLSIMFEIIRKYNLMMSHLKCVFKVSSRKFLSYIVYNREIKIDPKKNQNNL